MKILMDKTEGYESLLFGDVINLSDLYEICVPYAVKKSAVSLSTDVVLIKDISDKGKSEKSLILFRNDLPVLTELDSLSLLREYSKRNGHICEEIKETLILFYNSSFYKFPYLSEEVIYLPLSGCVRQNTDIINLTYLDGINDGSHNQSIISFSTHLDIQVPVSKDTLTSNVLKALSFVVVYFEMDSRRKPSLYADWLGKYLKSELVTARKNIYGLDVEYLLHCKKIVSAKMLIRKECPDWDESEINDAIERFKHI